jgi:hypothetical protein
MNRRGANQTQYAQLVDRKTEIAIGDYPPMAIESVGHAHCLEAALGGYDDALAVVDPQLEDRFETFVAPLLTCRWRIWSPGEKRRARRDRHQVIVACGGGRTLDRAKNLASNWNLDWIAVPTKPTSTVFTAAVSRATHQGVSTAFSRFALQVILLKELLSDLPQALFEAELQDTWSFQTAMRDVLLDELRNEAPWRRDYMPYFNEATVALDRISVDGPVAFSTVLALLRVQQSLCRVIDDDGSTRYVSGVEHLVTHALSRLGISALHGNLVGVGLLVGLTLQERCAGLAERLAAEGFRPMSRASRLRLYTACRPLICGEACPLSPQLLARALELGRYARVKSRFTVLDIASRSDCNDAIMAVALPESW